MARSTGGSGALLETLLEDDPRYARMPVLLL